ncbi:MAG: bifunctional (p)ppGpp synthetase/guanosine-3',5'-bis(diphosphate) 3'-pyrophosphohydrolase [Gammaproteobacteria bacterium]|nr:bifunctional (p)ppGpp synthetase/guanosine-3',5'-bis(diphosphate) 3'-pyrophosphohydrolase [Gammaproteobacteria bacterium]
MIKRRDDIPELAGDGFDLDGWVDAVCAVDAQLDREGLMRACHLLAAVPRHGSSLLSVGSQFAGLMADLHVDSQCVLVGLIYRAVRGGHVSLDTVNEQLGEAVGALYLELEKTARVSLLELSNAPLLERESADQVENVRSMLIAMIDDVRVALLKLSERIIALRFMKQSSTSRQLRAAQEVLSVFAPLANRLGVWRLKWELQDLAFRYVEPEIYRQVAAQLDRRRVEREREVAAIVETFSALLASQSIRAEVGGRAKHIYSIWQKMQSKGIPFSEVRDVRAVRVIVTQLHECYSALGVIHTRWHHIPQEFDDYIANPKENGYRSIHTAVIGPDDQVVEVQIRTLDMHREAELGVAAHWTYKDAAGAEGARQREKIGWLRQVLEWHDEVGGFTAIGNELRADIEDDRIYVLTPRGHVLEMPAGSTPVDFAYRVHTDIGHRCRGARVDGRVVALSAPLQTGQRVEIELAAQPSPSRDWLDPGLGYVTTPRARAKIQAWFRSLDRSQNEQAGEVMIVREFGRLGIALDRDRVAAQLGYSSFDSVCYSVGLGDRQVADLVEQLHPRNTDTPLRVQIRLEGLDRPGLLNDVTAVIREHHASMTALRAESVGETNTATMQIALETQGIAALARLIDDVMAIGGIIDVKRLE